MNTPSSDVSAAAGDAAIATRQRWLALLARATRAELDAALAQCPDAPDFVWLRPPQTGLALVQGRVGGSGERFNLGETTMTRCTLRQQDGTVGTGYVLGRDVERAARVARLDALLQHERHRAALSAGALQDIASRLASAQAEQAARVDASRVEFFTMVREAS